MYGLYLDSVAADKTPRAEGEADRMVENFADVLGLPKNCRLSYIDETLEQIPSVEEVQEGPDEEDVLVDEEAFYDPDAHAIPTEELERATQPVRNYIESLGLDVETTCGEPKVANFRMTNENDFKSRIPGEYSVHVKLKDKDGTELKFDIFVDAQTLELRHTSWNSETEQAEESAYWKPTKEQIQAVMAGRKQHYVLVVTKDVDTARRLTEQLYAEDAVVSAASGHRRVLDAMASNAVLAGVHGMGSSRGPDQVLTKPEEEERRKLLDQTYIRG